MRNKPYCTSFEMSGGFLQPNRILLSKFYLRPPSVSNGNRQAARHHGFQSSSRTARGVLSAYPGFGPGRSRMSGARPGGSTMTKKPESKDIPPMFTDERA